MKLLLELTLNADPEYRNGEAGEILISIGAKIYDAPNLNPSWRSTLRDSGKKKVGTVRVVK